MKITSVFAVALLPLAPSVVWSVPVPSPAGSFRQVSLQRSPSLRSSGRALITTGDYDSTTATLQAASLRRSESIPELSGSGLNTPAASGTHAQNNVLDNPAQATVPDKVKDKSMWSKVKTPLAWMGGIGAAGLAVYGISNLMGSDPNEPDPDATSASATDSQSDVAAASGAVDPNSIVSFGSGGAVIPSNLNSGHVDELKQYDPSSF